KSDGYLEEHGLSQVRQAHADCQASERPRAERAGRSLYFLLRLRFLREAVRVLALDLSQDGAGFGGGIGGLGDWTSYDDVSCTGGDGFLRSHDSCLIPVSSTGRAHSRSDDDELVPEFIAQGGSFVGGSHNPLAAIVYLHFPKSPHLVLNSSAHS